MSKESNFLIYCMERYRYFKGLSGADVAKNFEKYDIYGYITKYYEHDRKGKSGSALKVDYEL